jgi:protein-tyrosine phosphatase
VAVTDAGSRWGTGPMPEDRFAILAVCHANLCRSPLIHHLLKQALRERLGPEAGAFEVSSVGTHARPGLPMHPHTAAVLSEQGGDGGLFGSGEPTVERFRSRVVAADAVARADLILTADRPQRTICVSTIPSAAGRTFTVLQFGRLAAAIDRASLPPGPPIERARALVAEAHLVRAQFQPVAAEDDDLPDPVGLPLQAFRDCARRVSEETIDVMVGLLDPR